MRKGRAQLTVCAVASLTPSWCATDSIDYRCATCFPRPSGLLGKERDHRFAPQHNPRSTPPTNTTTQEARGMADIMEATTTATTARAAVASLAFIATVAVLVARAQSPTTDSFTTDAERAARRAKRKNPNRNHKRGKEEREKAEQERFEVCSSASTHSAQARGSALSPPLTPSHPLKTIERSSFTYCSIH